MGWPAARRVASLREADVRAKYDRFRMAPFARVRRLGAHARHGLSSDRSVAPGVLTVDQSAITQTLRRRTVVAEASLRWFESSSARLRPESRFQYGEDALLWGLFDEQALHRSNVRLRWLRCIPGSDSTRT